MDSNNEFSPNPSIWSEIINARNKQVGSGSDTDDPDSYKSDTQKALGVAGMKSSKSSESAKKPAKRIAGDQPITGSSVSSQPITQNKAITSSSSASSSSASSSSSSSTSDSSSASPNSSSSSHSASSKSTKPRKPTPAEKAVKRSARSSDNQADVAEHDPDKCRGISDKPVIALNQSRSAINGFISHLSKLYLANRSISKKDFRGLMTEVRKAFFTQYEALALLEVQTRSDMNVNNAQIDKMNRQISHLKEIHAHGVEHELMSRMAIYAQKMHDIYVDPRFQRMLSTAPKNLSKLTPSQAVLENKERLTAENNKYQKAEEKKAKNKNK